MKCFIVLLFMFCCVLKDFELWLCCEFGGGCVRRVCIVRAK